MKKILICTYSRNIKKQVTEIFSEWHYTIETVQKITSLEKKLFNHDFDVLLLDGNTFKDNRKENRKIIKSLSNKYPMLQIIFMVEDEDIKIAIDSLKAGTYQYLKLPIQKIELGFLVDTAIDEQPNIVSTDFSGNSIKTRFGEIIGASRPMQKVYNKIMQAASTDIPILILGETGTGKDLVAHTIHRMSTRSEQSYIPVNLGALPSELVASELFGHEKGSFTGAIQDHKGVFELGTTGSVFLDEIDTISEKVQVSLLRLLENKKFKPLGGKRSITSYARLITASNENLDALVEKNSFRMDLFYRLDVFRITLPPLRERRDDIPLLVNEMIAKYSQLYNKNINSVSQECIDNLINYDWPGNVRELKNLMQRTVIICNSTEINLDDLPPRFQNITNKVGEVSFKIGTSLDEIEREIILLTLNQFNNNKSKTAEVLGLSRRALYNKIAKHKL